jgi:uncharacterized membrane protein YcgQ (UPF0703/DUF1980 family)
MKALLAVARFVVWVIDAVCFIGMVALAFAFFLLLLGANPTAWFTQLVYSVARPFMVPFATLFPGEFFRYSPGQVGYVNLGIIVAFFVYALISAVVSWIYSALSGSYYRRQAQDSLARDVASISAASAAAAAATQAQANAQALQAQAAAQNAATAQAAQQAQAAAQAQQAAPVDMPPEVAPVPPPGAPAPAAPAQFPPAEQPPTPPA